MKKQTAFERAVDQRVADESTSYDPLMCRAKGCPNRWSVDSGDRGVNHLCSAHAWSDSRDWPQITQAQNDLATDRAMPKHTPSVPLLSAKVKLEILHALKAALLEMR
jgi:hypothetical protein